MKELMICGTLALVAVATMHEAAAASAKAKQDACVADALTAAYSAYPQNKVELIDVSDSTNSSATFHNVTVRKSIGPVAVKLRYICREDSFDAVSIVRREVLD